MTLASRREMAWKERVDESNRYLQAETTKTNQEGVFFKQQ